MLFLRLPLLGIHLCNRPLFPFAVCNKTTSTPS